MEVGFNFWMIFFLFIVIFISIFGNVTRNAEAPLPVDQSWGNVRIHPVNVKSKFLGCFFFKFTFQFCFIFGEKHICGFGLIYK